MPLTKPQPRVYSLAQLPWPAALACCPGLLPWPAATADLACYAPLTAAPSLTDALREREDRLLPLSPGQAVPAHGALQGRPRPQPGLERLL